MMIIIAKTTDKYSSYYQSLDKSSKLRYDEKLGMLGSVKDPYEAAATLHQQDRMDWLAWPNVEYPDIYNYFVTTPSVYTKQQFKAYKSLDGYKYFVDGWVSDVLVWSVSSRVCIVTGKVKHSQRLSASALQPWVAVEKDGLVVCAHCNCMAGLGEACSHVAGLLFLLEANSQLKKNVSCTSRPCYWLPPSFKNVPYARISEMDFSRPLKKRNKIVSTSLSVTSSVTMNDTASTSSVYKPSPTELNSFYSVLSQTGKPVLLSIVLNFCDAYIPLQSNGVLPQPLSCHFKEDYLALPYLDLLQKSEEVFETLTITTSQAKEVEKNTKGQSLSKTWFQQRAARITASKFKAAARSDVTQPSQSLIKSICYPENTRFFSKATTWGCTHENTALIAYETQERAKHSDFTVSSSGLVINTNYPHLGASPDGIANCTCCGKRVLEVKCPYSCMEKSFHEAAADSTFFLDEVDGKFQLKRDHSYYYQIQLQIKLCETIFGEFIVWRESELVVERIPIDNELLTDALKKTIKFYVYGVLPEVLGKWYSRLPQHQTTSSTSSDSVPSTSLEQADVEEKVWCYCGGEDDGEMIGCDNDLCKIQWFHTECLRIMKIPKGKWFCPDCSKGPGKRKKKKVS